VVTSASGARATGVRGTRRHLTIRPIGVRMIETVELDKLYRNKKTLNLYKVTGFASHTEREEELVLYVRWDVSGQVTFARPIQLFKEKFTEVG
jgi:hypothetical protein